MKLKIIACLAVVIIGLFTGCANNYLYTSRDTIEPKEHFIVSYNKVSPVTQGILTC